MSRRARHACDRLHRRQFHVSTVPPVLSRTGCTIGAAYLTFIGQYIHVIQCESGCRGLPISIASRVKDAIFGVRDRLLVTGDGRSDDTHSEDYGTFPRQYDQLH